MGNYEQRSKQSPSYGSSAALAVSFLVLLMVGAYFVLYPVFVMKILCFALFAVAFNLLLGHAGLMSFGHAAFFGGAAYATAHASKAWGWSPELAISLGVATAVLLGLAMGALAIRRGGIQFAMITLALAQMFYFLCNQASFTHGEDGIQGVPRGALFGAIPLDGNAAMYVFVCVIFLAGIGIAWRVVHSPFGRVLHAIRQNEARAISIGYPVQRYKLGIFMISAALAGLAGSTKALVFQLATLNDVTWTTSGEVVLITLIGGIGTFFGPLAGSAVVIGLEHALAGTSVPIPLILGLIFIGCVLVLRRGLVGEARAISQRLIGRGRDCAVSFRWMSRGSRLPERPG
jgi:branched-chain amino acid transport system permease protein